MYIYHPGPVLKARHVSGSAFSPLDFLVPKQAPGEIPLGSGIVVKINLRIFMYHPYFSRLGT